MIESPIRATKAHITMSVLPVENSITLGIGFHGQNGHTKLLVILPCL